MRGWGVAAAAACVCLAAGGENTPDRLFQAIRNNDLAALGGELRKGADVNARDRRGTTLLMHAAAYGSADAVKLLLDSGADVNARNSFDATALILGAADPQKARILVEKGADVNAHTKMGRTALMLAAGCDGCSETVRLLLAKGADPKARDVGGVQALHLVADADDLESMRLLLDKGAEADAPDGFGFTPLMNAADPCDLSAIKLLLSKGANVNAANNGHQDVKFGKIQLLGLTPLMLSAAYCPADVMKALLDAGAKVNVQDIRGMTPLMLAVASETQDLAVVQLLLKAGADVNAKSTAGETALDWAKKFGNSGTIGALSAADAHEGQVHASRERKARGARTAAQAAESAVALLQRAGTGFFQQSGCVSCHHQDMAVLATSAARAGGVRLDEKAAAEHIKMMEAQWTGMQEMKLERMDTGGLADGEILSLVALGAARYPANSVTDGLAGYVASYQHRDGSWWLGGTSRAPFEEGRIGRTALAMHALQLYAPPARKPEFEQRIVRARDFLAGARPATNDDRALQLAGLHWAGAGAEELRALGRAVLAAQREDGGWAQNRNLPSDAYATGESLWALNESGVLKPSDPAYQRGLKYLLSTQWEDGSWYVASRAPKFQPYFQSGFPYDHDQWISSAATAWAVMAVAPAAQNERMASR